MKPDRSFACSRTSTTDRSLRDYLIVHRCFLFVCVSQQQPFRDYVSNIGAFRLVKRVSSDSQRWPERRISRKISCSGASGRRDAFLPICVHRRMHDRPGERASGGSCASFAFFENTGFRARKLASANLRRIGGTARLRRSHRGAPRSQRRRLPARADLTESCRSHQWSREMDVAADETSQGSNKKRRPV